MAKETPLQTMKRLYGSKDKLVDSLAKAAQQADEDLDEAKTRLMSASNKKLLRLAEVTSSVADKYGSVDKLADALATTLGRAKDSDYVAKLRTLSAASLLDRMRAAERRTGRQKTA